MKDLGLKKWLSQFQLRIISQLRIKFKNPAIGILHLDLETQELIFLVIAQKEDDYYLQYYAMESFPAFNLNINNSYNFAYETLLPILNQLLKQTKKNCKNIVLVLPEAFVETRKIALANKQNLVDMQEQIEQVFEQLIPFALEDSYYDYHLEDYEILIVACPRKRIDTWNAAVKSLGFSLESVSHATSTSADLSLADPFATIKPASNIDEDLVKKIRNNRLLFLSLFGLSMQCLHYRLERNTPSTINLLPWREYLRKNKNKNFYRLMFSIVLLSLILMLVLNLCFYYQELQLKSNIMYLSNFKAQIAIRAKKVEALQQAKNNFSQRLEVIQSLETDHARWFKFLNSLPLLLPEGIHLINLTGRAEAITMEGSARTHSCVAGLLRNLANHKDACLFKEIKLAEITSDKQDASLKFKLQFRLDLPTSEIN